MINTQMRNYPYYKYATSANEYGQETLNLASSGTIKIAINITSREIKDSVLYSEAEYIGLTRANIDDKTVIDFNGKKLKVLFVNPIGRLNQAFLKGIE